MDRLAWLFTATGVPLKALREMIEPWAECARQGPFPAICFVNDACAILLLCFSSLLHLPTTDPTRPGEIF